MRRKVKFLPETCLEKAKEMTDKLTRIGIKLLMLCAVVLCFWIVIANMSFFGGVPYSLIPLSLLAIVCVHTFALDKVLITRDKLMAWWLKRPVYVKYLLWGSLVLISVMARFSFVKFGYQPASDPAQFNYSATHLAENGDLGVRSYYNALFPYLFAYNVSLAGVMKIFGSGVVSVIVCNILFDAIATVLLYVLVKRITNSATSAKIAMALWIISPFNIIFSAISLPIVAVNTMIIASVLCVYLLISGFKKNTKTVLLLSVVTGVVFSVANSFRPIMAVFIIALVIYCVASFIQKPGKTLARKMTMSIAVLLITFVSLNAGFIKLVSHVTGYENIAMHPGWSIYLGGNVGSHGGWNAADTDYADHVRAEEVTIIAAHERLKKEGIERWKQMSPAQAAVHLVNKSVVLSGGGQYMIYNISSYPELWQNKRVIALLHLWCALYFYGLLLFSAKFLLSAREDKHGLNFIHFVILLFVGLFLASLCVEVAARYFSPFLIFLNIFTAIVGGNILCKRSAVKTVTARERF
jgi:hypothetical protein